MNACPIYRTDYRAVYLVISYNMTTKKFPTEFVEKATPVSDDLLFIADSADSNKVKKIKYSNVKGTKGDPIVWR